MPIQLRCNCGQLFAVADRYAGTKLRCPKCSSVNNVPLESLEPVLVESLTTVPSLNGPTWNGNGALPTRPPALPTNVRLTDSSYGAQPGSGQGPPRDPLGVDAPATGTMLRGSPFRPRRVTIGYRSEPYHALGTYWLGVGLALLAFFQLIPVLVIGSPAAAPTWGAMVWLIVIAQLAYAAWMVCVPHWSTVWIGMVATVVVAAIYALGLGLVLVTPRSSAVWFELDDVRDSARLWCGSVVLLTFLMAYACGRVSYKWRKSQPLLAPGMSAAAH
jgi:phage FluMu protein Com